MANKAGNTNPKPELVEQKGGPQTEAGKRTASRNSTTHGLYARTIDAFAPADRLDFEALHREYATHYNPKDLIDHELVQQLAFNRFRYYRFLRFQEAAFSVLPDDDDAAALRELDTRAKTHQYLERALTQLDRAFHRTLRLLEERQKQAKAAETELVEIGVTLETGTIDYTSDPGLDLLLKNPETNSPQAHDYLRILAVKPKGPRAWLEDCHAA